MNESAALPRETVEAPSRAPAIPAVGTRIHALREAMGLSLRDLAERSGVSAPMLSQVERGETSPTLAVAAKIAAGLELTLSQLLRLDEGQHVAVSRAGDRRRFERGGHRIEELTPAACPASAPTSPCTSSSPAPPPAAARTRRCTSPAAARPPWSSPGRWR